MQFIASGVYKKIRSIADNFLSFSPSLRRLLYRHKIGIKYVLSGGTAAVVDLSLLYALTELAGFWYLVSASIAYIASFFTAFFLQKFWTFRDSSLRRIKKQILIYGLIAVVSLLLNSVFMYVLVSIIHIWYMAAQFVISGILAIGSFITNKGVTFKSVSKD